MCEHYVARAAEPFRLDELWPFTERLEQYGLAGYGWGAAWTSGSGALCSYRDIRAFRDDPARADVGREEALAVLVHLRRPSRLSTIGLPDTQPFDDPAGRFSFSHNGDLHEIGSWRRRYREQGRIHGRADTEVGARWLEDRWNGTTDPAASTALLAELHEEFGGQANLATIARDGAVAAYAGNTENPVFSFRIGRIGVVSTGIYSLDRSLFRFVAPTATERRMVRVGGAVTLDRHGGPSPAS
jgi:glutamine phosphoribosylpyrophosphate amidotransferase